MNFVDNYLYLEDFSSIKTNPKVRKRRLTLRDAMFVRKISPVVKKALPVVKKTIPAAVKTTLPVAGGVAVGVGGYLLYKELQKRKKLKQQKKQQKKQDVKIYKIGKQKIIDLRNLINKKAKEKTPDIINVRPVVEQRVAQEQTKNLMLMGIPLALYLLL